MYRNFLPEKSTYPVDNIIIIIELHFKDYHLLRLIVLLVSFYRVTVEKSSQV